MKLLLATINSKNPNTELALRYLYGITVNSPINNIMRVYDSDTSDSCIYEDVINNQYDIVYFHCDEFNEEKISSILSMVKKAMPSIAIVVGGMHVSINTKYFMQMNPSVDFVIRGEGETVLFNFLKTLLSGRYAFDNVRGLAFRYNGEIYMNKMDELLPMDNLPFPYEDLEISDLNCVYYETFRGTTDRTAYSVILTDGKVRPLPIQRVFTELRYLLVKEVKRVVILDKFFNYNADRAFEIFDFIINNDNEVTTFEVNINGDFLDDETFRLLSKARKGLFKFNVDLVSINAETLEAVGRGENVYLTMYNISNLLKNENICCNILIKAGLPFETEGMFARTFNKTFGLSNDTSLNVEILKLPIGSALRKNANKFGYYFSEKAPYEVLGNAHISAKEMILLRHISIITNIYANYRFSNIIINVLTDFGYKPYDFFKRFAIFASTENLVESLDNELDSYRIIYKFLKQIYIEEPNKLSEFKETIYDSMEKYLSEDDIKEFDREGWEIEL